nr:MAG TPA: hypothetical protein [Caudoviricetes sp.]
MMNESSENLVSPNFLLIFVLKRNPIGMSNE